MNHIVTKYIFPIGKNINITHQIGISPINKYYVDFVNLSNRKLSIDKVFVHKIMAVTHFANKDMVIIHVDMMVKKK